MAKHKELNNDHYFDRGERFPKWSVGRCRGTRKKERCTIESELAEGYCLDCYDALLGSNIADVRRIYEDYKGDI